jgi:hypothetical protein
MGPCDNVMVSRSIASTLASPSCLGAVLARGRPGRVVQARLNSFQAGFRIDQELRRDDHLLARLQAALDLGLAAGLDTRLDSTGLNLPFSSATITTVRLPVWITASVGSAERSRPRVSMNCMETNMPGTSRSRGWRVRGGP